MGIWGDFAHRHFNISSIEEPDGWGLESDFAHQMNYHDINLLVSRRSLSCGEAIVEISAEGFSHIVESKASAATIVRLLYNERLGLGSWTGFWSRLDQKSVFAFRERMDAEIVEDEIRSAKLGVIDEG